MDGNNKVATGGSGCDWINDLFGGILEHVLFNLPSANTVRSSVLSRWWLSAWTHAPGLNLSDEHL